MSRRKVETYQIICDGCGEMLEDGEGYTCYLDYPNGIEDCALMVHQQSVGLHCGTSLMVLHSERK